MKKWLATLLLVGLVLGVRSLAGAEARTIVKFWSDIVVEEGMRVRDAVAIGGNVTVDGVVEHDAVAVAGSVILGSKAVVGRNVVSVGGAIDKAEGAVVRGDLTEVNIPGMSSVLRSVSWPSWEELRWVFGVISFVAFVGFLALGLVIVAVFPKAVGLISAAVEDTPLRVSLWGLLGMLLIVPLAIFLAVSVVGIVLIPLEIFIVVCAFLVGYIAVAQLIGKKIATALKRPDQPMIWEAFWGMIILWVIGWVPVLGWLVKTVASLLGLGGAIAALLSARKS
jgi:hypothetical protein